MITANEARCIAETYTNIYGRAIYNAAKQGFRETYVFVNVPARDLITDVEYENITFSIMRDLTKLGYKTTITDMQADRLLYKLKISWE